MRLRIKDASGFLGDLSDDVGGSGRVGHAGDFDKSIDIMPVDSLFYWFAVAELPVDDNDIWFTKRKAPVGPWVEVLESKQRSGKPGTEGDAIW